MKWETIKNRCVREACDTLRSPFLNTALISVSAISDLLNGNLKRKYNDTTLTRGIHKELTDNGWELN